MPNRVAWNWTAAVVAVGTVVTAGAIAAVSSLVTVNAQATTSPVEFEVASVRPNTLDDHIVTIDAGRGRFVVRGYTLKLLIQWAWGIRGYQIAGGPSWLDGDRYDISAKAPADTSDEQLKPMLQALLADRFKLRVHPDTKEMSGFALSELAGGAKLKATSPTEEHPGTWRREGTAIVGQGITPKELAITLGGYLGQPVVDQTGLKGMYDVRLSWTERADQMPNAADPAGVSLISALRDQLGLRLTARRVPAEILVVDRAEKATAN